MKSALLALAAMLLAAAPAAGQIRPRPGDGDPRLQTVDFVPDQVVVLEVAPGYQLTVELAPDEQIENVAVGDSGAWQVTANRRGDRLFIKALQPGVTTNMTVITSARLYAMDLVPLYGPSPEMAYTVRFRFPEAGEEEPEESAEAAVEGHYRVTGARRLRPSRIGDDGRQTFIEWPEDRSLPAVYAVGRDGQESLVNGMMRDGIYVIDSVAQRLVFRIDRNVARAERVAMRPGAR